MRAVFASFAAALVALTALASAPTPSWARSESGLGTIHVAELPAEARETLAHIKSGGPFPYHKDGVVFGNFEKRLPAKPRGYYHEYTVPTPGRHDRGPRRIVAGAGASGDVRSSGEYYYTDDHYRTFRRVVE